MCDDELLSTPNIIALLAKSLPTLREYAPSSTIPIMQAGVFIYSLFKVERKTYNKIFVYNKIPMLL